MKTFKTVSEFKKILAIGDKLHAVNHTKTIGRDEQGKVIYGDYDMGIREVSIKQTTLFALKTTRTDGTTVDSYCQFPKASESKIEGNKIILYERDWRLSNGHTKDTEHLLPLIPVLTYSFVD